MLKINLICMGDIKENYLKDAIKEYQKRLSRFANLQIVELKENNPKSDGTKDILLALKKDAEEIKKHIKGYAICLDIDAKQFSSEEFADKIKSISLKSGEISFIIGASNGIDEEIKQMCKEKISFSKMTFPHQLMRVIFLEQLYRAFTINNNISYHK
ncbi:MAG: 23S rRNA (pseudouridine(1915)-N(3))-methyltransferase RlmH [Clostridia bacterium]|nr:23S rRNA (pseudouridine(1915)-N(3))-methyltransferase RlmH [Clostridia bacterium]